MSGLTGTDLRKLAGTLGELYRTVSRVSRDFSERDRAALDFLRPHLAQAYASAAALTALGLDVGALTQAAGQECEGTAPPRPPGSGDGAGSTVSGPARG